MPPYRHLSLLLTGLTIQYWCISHTTYAQPVNGSATHVLLDYLTNNYPKMGKFAVPRWGPDPVHVKVSPYTLLHITAVDREQQTVSFRTSALYKWKDDFLSWDPDQFEGLTSIQLPAEKVWTPDIAVYNVVSEKCTHADTVIISDSGTVILFPTCIQEIRCRIDFTYFPFDKQTCKYDMGSWLGDNRTLIIEEFRIMAFVGTFDWEIHNVTSELQMYDYETDIVGRSYAIATVTFVLHHRAPVFAFLLILPAALLSVLTSVVFLLPSCNEAKIDLGLSIFLSFMVLLNVLMDATPGSSSGVPLLGYYFTVNSLLIAMSVFCATIVLRIYNKSTSHKNMSLRLKTLTLFMAKVLRMKTERRPTDMKGLDDLTPAGRMVDTTPDNSTPKNDWVLLASVLDRFFFIIYIVINVTATLVIFIKYREDRHG